MIKVKPTQTALNEYNKKIKDVISEYDTKSLSKGGSLVRQCLSYLEDNDPRAKEVLENSEKEFKVISQGSHIILPELVAYTNGEAINPPLIVAVLYEQKIFTDETTLEEKEKDFFKMVNSIMLPDDTSFFSSLKNFLLGKPSPKKNFFNAANKLWELMNPVVANKTKMTLTLAKNQCDMLDRMIKDGTLKKPNRAQKRNNR